ncbi:MAG TPA: DUF3040 domain-containing protein [Trebonia sp.]|jgi:hypothetical protein
MSLSARDQRILTEIARDLAAAEPRLARALGSARLPTLLRRRHLVADSGQRPPSASGQRHLGAWVTATLASLLAGIALLMAGLALHIPALACAGAVMIQASAAGLGYVCARGCRSRPGTVTRDLTCRLPPRFRGARLCSPCTPPRTY